LLTHKRFDHDKPTAMFVFGWLQSVAGDTSRQLVDAYIERGDYNFLVLDWSDYNVDPYTIVMFRMSKISRMVGRTFTKLFKKGLDDESFHCIGKEFAVRHVPSAASMSDLPPDGLIGSAASRDY
jgi:hypothetical protein